MRHKMIRAAALLMALVLLPVAFLSAQDGGTAEPTTQRDPLEIYEDLSLFGEVFDLIRAEYVDAIDERELIRSAIQGMLSSLDPHSGYLPPAAYDEVLEDNSGTFAGLGIEVIMENEVVVVVSPIDDTPAVRAGILANDRIIRIDGVSIAGETLDWAVSRMRGPVGTSVTLTIERDGLENPIEITVVRDVITLRVVRWSLEGDVAVLRLARFSEQAFAGLQRAINDIYAARDGVAPKGLILDLRNNPGGLVDQSVFVADAFLRQGAVLLTRGRSGGESTRYDAQPDALDARLTDVPMVVLINGGSASAAEIVAGALQDHNRATLVGTRSFGKGSVQTILSLGTNGAMRLTTARYYTPSNRSIQAAGIQPDILVTQVVPEELQGRDEIIGEAGLDGHIPSENGEEAAVGSSVYVPADKDADTQLQYAIRLINGEETHPAYPARPGN